MTCTRGGSLYGDFPRLRGGVFTGARYVFALSVKTLLAGAKESQSWFPTRDATIYKPFSFRAGAPIVSI